MNFITYWNKSRNEKGYVLSKAEGFTLIEMLVVVAIIGLLSSVILTALGPARDKAKDTRIISDINQVRSIAETLYTGNYDALESLPSTNIRNQNLKLLSDDIISQLPVGAVGLTS